MRLEVDSRLSIKRTLQVILGAAQFVFADQLVFQLPELLHDGSHDLLRRLGARAGIDGEATGIAEKIQFGVNRVGKTLLLADVLKQPRTHAAAKHGIQNVKRESAVHAPADRQERPSRCEPAPAIPSFSE